MGNHCKKIIRILWHQSGYCFTYFHRSGAPLIRLWRVLENAEIQTWGSSNTKTEGNQWCDWPNDYQYLWLASPGGKKQCVMCSFVFGVTDQRGTYSHVFVPASDTGYYDRLAQLLRQNSNRFSYSTGKATVDLFERFCDTKRN